MVAALTSQHLVVRLRGGSVASWRIGPHGSLGYVGTATGSAVGPAGLIAD